MAQYFNFPFADVISNTLAVPSSSLAFPIIILDVILPFVFLWYLIYLLLRKVGVFRNSSTWVDAVIGLLPAVFLIRLGRILLWPSLYAIVPLKLESWKARIAAWVALTIVIIFISPYITF